MQRKFEMNPFEPVFFDLKLLLYLCRINVNANYG
jgi:hypothetical protein